MPDPTTSNIKLAVPSHGADVDTWDQPLNDNAGILDSAFGSVTSKSLSNTNVTLSDSEAQASILRFSGALTGNVTINVGAIVKSWYIDNLTTGNFVVTISGGSGNVVGVPQGEIVQVVWDGTNVKFINLDRVGAYWDDSGSAVPAWVTACTVPPYLLCDGSTFNASTYPYLNTKLGGNTLPDFRGRMAAFLNGGASRITTAGSGIDGDTRFSAGGFQSITLDVSMMPSHTHTQNSHSHSLSTILTSGTGANLTSPGSNFVSVSVSTANSTDGTVAVNQNTGGGGSHNNMPPTCIAGIRMIRAA